MEKTYPVFTLKTECNDCYKCIRDCHVKAIRIQGGSASVINEKCIACGHCVTICPVGAIQNGKIKIQITGKEAETINSGEAALLFPFQAHEYHRAAGTHYIRFNFDSELASEEFISRMHRDDTLVWVNSIIYDYKEQLAGEHSDDTALTVSRDFGWGWLADKNFDIIQTDWTLAMCQYLNETGKRFKK